MIALVNARTTWCQKVLVLYFATILFVPLSSARMMPSLHCHRCQPISVLTKNSCKIHTLDILVTLTVCQRLLEHACQSSESTGTTWQCDPCANRGSINCYICASRWTNQISLLIIVLLFIIEFIDRTNPVFVMLKCAQQTIENKKVCFCF